MKKLSVIIYNTFLESFRSKIMYICLVFALAMIGLAPLLGSVSAGEEKKVIQDMGLSAISFFGVLIAILVGTTLVYNEIEKKTIYTILSKPVERYQFFLGKYLGLCFTLLVVMATMALFLIPFLWWNGISLTLALFQALVLEFLSLCLLTAFATFFSALTTPILTAFFTTSLYLIGITVYTIQVPEQAKEIASYLMPLYKAMSYLIPNFQNFNIKVRVAHGLSVPWTEFGYALSYGLLYIAIVLVLGIILFQRKDFK